MPATEKNDAASAADMDEDDFREFDREKDKGHKSKQSSSKSKDLSHVPCKFFKVGSCTAGAACPFSHSIHERGQPKDVCTWFIKGNCKFGHKCALAHILPGQSMAMDRKNKKSAQLANNGASSAGGPGREPKSSRSKKDGHQSSASADVSAKGRTGLLSGSTAPTRVLNMPLKATVSPSAPAPPLKDSDFASFGLPDDQLSSVPVHAKVASPTSPDDTSAQLADQDESFKQHDQPEQPKPEGSPPTLPVHSPTPPRHLGISRNPSDAAADLGPIGSPPRSSPAARSQNLSPGTSPARHITSPLSAPGNRSVFPQNDSGDLSFSDFKTRAGLAQSLPWNTDLGPIPPQVQSRAGVALNGSALDTDAVGEDFEEFIPSSLTDLLTPEERSRRMSRTTSGRPVVPGADAAYAANRATPDSAAHRYSRSVPAASLLGDINSIWSDKTNGLPGSPDTHGHLGVNGLGIGNGTPSSFKSNGGFGGRSFLDDGPSPSLLAPSNASAAFLPNLHHYYSKMGPQRPSSNLGRSASGLHPPPGLSQGLQPISALTASGPGPGAGVDAFSPPRTSSLGTHPPLDNHHADSYLSAGYGKPMGMQRSVSGRPISNGFGGDGDGERTSTISPSMRALQSHAPGQSLPQGLAAGYSRIHALPTTATSPNVPGGLSPGPGPAPPGSEWPANIANAPSPDMYNMSNSKAPTPSSPGLEAMFSRLSYSAATSRPGAAASPPGSSPLGGGMPRQVSHGHTRNWQGHGPLSPLNGPAVTNDDDDELFSMDG
ncbi:hypothetical protein CONPUDRAFT_108759 [Coniophora puteana RWD-64-598 SS2]|uniref:C3H1-type domain-containing protein n=1 Tax=Coniophora puteana (strain RWD-64-598) TaxID=741705 RepID=A0A5M3MIK8_CONPW|nr:uncharacterized protein CONPUDRAFT_108759 [Coniophora puteana RWD-64-598 SS2]EIW78750.1 hypothetical protein CONPUDRAFT_108759 [Coniophora puteana RWD-64-598 SS2]